MIHNLKVGQIFRHTKGRSLWLVDAEDGKCRHIAYSTFHDPGARTTISNSPVTIVPIEEVISLLGWDEYPEWMNIPKFEYEYV